MTVIHNDLAHPGSKRLYYTLKDYINCKNLKKVIESITATCLACHKNKDCTIRLGRHPGYLFSQNPFEYISSDIFGPIKTRHFETNFNQKYFYILTIQKSTVDSCAYILFKTSRPIL
ncbi:hypothetical protein EQH57_0398 [Dictyocoela roeselum]|nr:hypothetical protein EQH57_0398 [Dictyocoela roeselum]